MALPMFGLCRRTVLKDGTLGIAASHVFPDMPRSNRNASENAEIASDSVTALQ